ncbi:MAG: hypothetical protein J3K34DRAFT_42935 [Monoraphidium minutum]|nr:MAG: hypothetical protein J3K34DRAFT_42935 [Monoraphidium minutum]
MRARCPPRPRGSLRRRPSPAQAAATAPARLAPSAAARARLPSRTRPGHVGSTEPHPGQSGLSTLLLAGRRPHARKHGGMAFEKRSAQQHRKRVRRRRHPRAHTHTPPPPHTHKCRVATRYVVCAREDWEGGGLSGRGARAVHSAHVSVEDANEAACDLFFDDNPWNMEEYELEELGVEDDEDYGVSSDGYGCDDSDGDSDDPGPGMFEGVKRLSVRPPGRQRWTVWVEPATPAALEEAAAAAARLGSKAAGKSAVPPQLVGVKAARKSAAPPFAAAPVARGGAAKRGGKAAAAPAKAAAKGGGKKRATSGAAAAAAPKKGKKGSGEARYVVTSLSEWVPDGFHSYQGPGESAVHSAHATLGEAIAAARKVFWGGNPWGLDEDELECKDMWENLVGEGRVEMSVHPEDSERWTVKVERIGGDGGRRA